MSDDDEYEYIEIEPDEDGIYRLPVAEDTTTTLEEIGWLSVLAIIFLIIVKLTELGWLR